MVRQLIKIICATTPYFTRDFDVSKFKAQIQALKETEAWILLLLIF